MIIIKTIDFFFQMKGSKPEPLLNTAPLKNYSNVDIMTYEEDDVAGVYFLLKDEAK